MRAKIAGAIRDLGDSSGDSRLFSEALARICREKHGATIRLGTRVSALRAEGDRIDGVVTSDGVLTADNYVLALGVGAPDVARTAGSEPADLSGQGLLLDVSRSSRAAWRRRSPASTSSGWWAGRGSATGSG